jgi:hypothetical protein
MSRPGVNFPAPKAARLSHRIAVGGLSLVLLTWSLTARAQQPTLSIVGPTADEPGVRLQSSVHPESLVLLEASPNLRSWTTVGTFHDSVFSYPDIGAAGLTERFYRAQLRPREAEDDWRNQVWFPDDPFRSATAGQEVSWVKFAIVLDEPWRVVYQDSRKFPFHYDFATERLEAFEGLDRAGFDDVTLHRDGQRLLLGALLYPPRTSFHEYGVQFIGLDPYAPEDIAGWMRLVEGSVHAADDANAVYMPTFEQSEMARTNAAAFAELGVTVASVDRWVAGSHVYAPGWAVGRLKFFPALESAAAFADGRLLPEDLLLTDGVPVTTPLVAGIISLTPSTPNSHTAILAKSFGIPFVHLPDAVERERVQDLAGRRVILRTTASYQGTVVKVIDVEDLLPPDLEAELLELKRPAPIGYAAKEPYGAVSASTDDLHPADIRFFGGKAANFGLLRRTIPANSPSPAIALSFDLWDQFLDQPLLGWNRTLRTEVALRLAPHSSWPTDIPALKQTLDGIRGLFRDVAEFSPAQRQAITNVLSVFDPARKIRFRSSTNVEDSEHFTGAGLYDSYSGCLLDDLDGDTIGPSICDPSKSNERGVFRAIQRVYASFYNDNAFLERLRHGVDESEVAMGVLVHHSFPDEEELANGVAALDCRYGGFPFISGELVTQLGAESVTNPDGSALPEVVGLFRSGNIVGFDLIQHSSRVPLGASVMEWETDYRGLEALFKAVADRFHDQYPEKPRFYLDLEYKKDINLGLVVKQVREIPSPATTNQTVPFLFDEPATWVVAQREAGDVFGNHRLKSVWALHADTMRLTASNLAGGIYSHGSVDYLEDGEVIALNGALNDWPNASSSSSGEENHWTTGAGPALRRWTLHTTVITHVTGAQPPVFTQNDFSTHVSVDYTTPQATISQFKEFTTTTNEIAFLEPRRVLGPNDILQVRRASKPGVVAIETSFYWPNEPPAAAGYTAPLVRFVETRIEGLTREPIVLTGYYSQTYRPGHHNFTEEFIFEPRLEPGLPAATLAELQAVNIRFLHLELGFTEPVINVLGMDGKLRRL